METKKKYMLVGAFVVIGIMLILAIYIRAGDILISEDSSINLKTYDAINREALITAPTGVEIAKVKLNTPLVYYVDIGNDIKVAEINIEANSSYANAISKMEFTDLRTKLAINKNIRYKQKITTIEKEDDYYFNCSNKINSTSLKKELICDKIINGTRNKEVISWNELSDLNIQKGNITIGLFTDVKQGDRIDFVPTIFDVKMSEWATWIGGNYAHGLTQTVTGSLTEYTGVLIRIKQNVSLVNVTLNPSSTDTTVTVYSAQQSGANVIWGSALQVGTVTSGVANFSINLSVNTATTFNNSYFIVGHKGGASRTGYFNMTDNVRPVVTTYFNYTNGAFSGGGTLYACMYSGACGGNYLGDIASIGINYLDTTPVLLNITGKVVDSRGFTIGNASILLLNSTGGIVTNLTSNNSGDWIYAFENDSIRNYTIVGYNTYNRSQGGNAYPYFSA